MSAVITTAARRVGRYAITSRLATGGQAAVYLAHIETPGEHDASREVVIKTVKPGGQAAVTRRALAREERALGCVTHPHVVRLLDEDLEADPPYLVLEYVPGVDLHRLMRLSTPGSKGVPEDLVCFICLGVASALSALHDPADGSAPRIFHGDVSPSNILLSKHGDVKLSDFGLARCEGGTPMTERRPATPPLTMDTIWGHRGFLAPERLEGGLPSPQGDVFALGVVLGELLTGGPAFQGDGSLARLIAMKEGRLAESMYDSANVSPRLLEFCRRCLSPRPEQRPTAREATELLGTYGGGPDGASRQRLVRSLSAWVEWATERVRNQPLPDEHLRESVRVLRASRSISGTSPRVQPRQEHALLRSARNETMRELSYSELVAMAASGQLDGQDEVALSGESFQRVSSIPVLARHLLPSSTALTCETSPLGPPDYCEELGATSLLPLIGKLAAQRATGLLLVERRDESHDERREIYVHEARVTHVSSSRANDLLGESLVRAQVITRQDLRSAVRHMLQTNMHLGESLVALRLVDPVVIYQALCVQGRDRVAQTCTWTSGVARFHCGVHRPAVAFPLDVDLHLCLVQAVQSLPRVQLTHERRVLPLPGCPPPRSAPSSLPLLNLVPGIARKRLTVGTALEELSSLSARSVTTDPVTYLLAAQALGWVEFSAY